MTEVICINRFSGIHAWSGCPNGFLHDYLASPHRHEFMVETRFRVTDDDRQIEFLEMQDRIAEYVAIAFPLHAGTSVFDFGGLSCEMLARRIADYFHALSCEVREDGFGGAKFVREGV